MPNKMSDAEKRARLDAEELARLIYNGNIGSGAYIGGWSYFWFHQYDLDDFEIKELSLNATGFLKDLYKRYGNPVPAFKAPNTALDAVRAAAGKFILAKNSNKQKAKNARAEAHKILKAEFASHHP